MSVNDTAAQRLATLLQPTRASIRLLRLEPFTNAQWRGVLLRDPCVYCSKISKDLDHIHPRNYGGSEGWPNLAPACKACNQMKADGTLMWMLWRRRESELGRKQRRVVGHRRVREHGRMVWVPIATALEYQGRLGKPEHLGEAHVLQASTE